MGEPHVFYFETEKIHFKEKVETIFFTFYGFYDIIQLKDKFDFEKQLEHINDIRRAKMFESVKIIRECKSILKKHNIKYCENFRIFKRFGLIHCQVEDWRGPVEVDGFPAFTAKKAIGLLVESCAFSHYCDLKKRTEKILPKSIN